MQVLYPAPPVSTVYGRNWLASVVLMPLGVLYVLSQGQYEQFDALVLMAHEVGHHMFDRFGGLAHYGGGLLTMTLIPALLTLFAWVRGLRFTTQVSLFWLAQSCFFLSFCLSGAAPVQYSHVQQDLWQFTEMIHLVDFDALFGLGFFMAGLLSLCGSIALPLAER